MHSDKTTAFINFLLNASQQQQESNTNLLYFRTKSGVYGQEQVGSTLNKLSSANKCMLISSQLITADNDNVYIGPKSIECPGINTIDLSPDQEYIIVQLKKECLIISRRTQLLVTRLPIPKQFKKLLFDSTNSLCFLKGDTHIQVYETSQFTMIKQFLYPEGADFEISVQRDNLFLSFVTLQKCLELTKTNSLFQIQDYTQQFSDSLELPSANEVKQLWSPNGKTLLIWTQQLEDHTNQSYFGLHSLHIYQYKATSMQPINLFDGPIHDVVWVQSNFIVLSGYMPAGAVLYNQYGQQTYLISQSHTNQIYLSPNNVHVAFCGFGNLPGDVYIYDLKQMKRIATCKKDKVVQFLWSPCGNYFMTTTTFPRLRVDNQITIYSKEGQLVYTQKFDELYDAVWGLNVKVVFKNVIPIQEQKQVKSSLFQGHDFIKEMQNSNSISNDPRPLGPNEQLPNTQRKVPQQQEAVVVVPQPPVKTVLLMRRQEPLLEEAPPPIPPKQKQKRKQQQQQEYQQPNQATIEQLLEGGFPFDEF